MIRPPDSSSATKLVLLDDEIECLAQSARCEGCGHLDILHDHCCYECCNVPGCRCQYGVIQPLRDPAPVPLTNVAPVREVFARQVGDLGQPLDLPDDNDS